MSKDEQTLMTEGLYKDDDIAAALEIYSDEAFGEVLAEVQRQLKERHLEALEKGEIVTPFALMHCIRAEGFSGFLTFPMALDLNDDETARETARSIGRIAYQDGYAPLSWFLACRTLEPDQLLVQGHAIGGRVQEAMAALSPDAQFYKVTTPKPFGFLQEIFASYVLARALDIFGPSEAINEHMEEMKKTTHLYGSLLSIGKLDG